MGQLKLYGMRTVYDEIITTAVKRQHEPQQIIGDLLHAEITEKQARSVKYQITTAELPLAKEIDEFDFEAADGNETLIRDLATGDFLDHQRNLILNGGTGTGKTHLAVSIARACIREGRRSRFFNVVDLVNSRRPAFCKPLRQPAQRFRCALQMRASNWRAMFGRPKQSR